MSLCLCSGAHRTPSFRLLGNLNFSSINRFRGDPDPPATKIASHRAALYRSVATRCKENPSSLVSWTRGRTHLSPLKWFIIGRRGCHLRRKSDRYHLISSLLLRRLAIAEMLLYHQIAQSDAPQAVIRLDGRVFPQGQRSYHQALNRIKCRNLRRSLRTLRHGSASRPRSEKLVITL
jgi:hypothetical protein